MDDNHDNRLLSDSDVNAIVTQLKAQLLSDFQVNVGKGVLDWIKKAVLVLLFALALKGISGDRAVLEAMTMQGAK
ncbi:hypothetical protein [Novosphingobium sp.]|uniref:hypothetical protein n=1 Tax=Novosphingobium sp. TaxID=1874826 RepID=UPI0038B78E5F